LIKIYLYRTSDIRYGENVRKVIAILLLAVLVTATLAFVVTSKQAKATRRITPLYGIRTVRATKNKEALSKVKANYLMKNRIFIWSWLKLTPLFSQRYILPSTPQYTCEAVYTCLTSKCIIPTLKCR